MPVYQDQLKREVELRSKPQRIISIVPSQTELLYDLGLDAEVVGITKFCVHPKIWFRNKQRIGGTKTLHIERIRSLQPDLLIANKEENVEAQVKELAKEFAVWTSDVNNLQDAYDMIHEVGRITGREENASKLVEKIRNGFSQLGVPDRKLQTAYLIWKDPIMTVGGDCFIHDMLGKAGFDNVFEKRSRYPQISIEELRAANCQVVLLSSEPYPFRQKHVEELQHHLPRTKIILVDGEMFSWYGSRLAHAPAYFRKLQEELTAIV